MSFRMRRVVFFFQAEDGIRDADVTGVQTCALPISAHRAVPWADQATAHERPPERQRYASSSLAYPWFLTPMICLTHKITDRLRIVGWRRSEERRVGKSGGVGGRWTQEIPSMVLRQA